MDASGNAKKPSAITAVQILLYLAALVNVVNGFLAIGDTGIVKKIVSAAMILIGTAALWAGLQLNTPTAARRNGTLVLCVLMIVLRVIEYAIWSSVGFLLGIILPVLVIWRLSSAETRQWFGIR